MSNEAGTVKRLVASIVQFLGDQMSSTGGSLTPDAKESLEGESLITHAVPLDMSH